MQWYCITFACTFSANIALHMLAYTKVYETTDRAAKAGRSTLMEHCTCWLIPKSTKQQMGLAKQDDLPLWSTRKVNLNFNASSLCEVHFFFFFSSILWCLDMFLFPCNSVFVRSFDECAEKGLRLLFVGNIIHMGAIHKLLPLTI